MTNSRKSGGAPGSGTTNLLPADKEYYCKNITHESNIKSASKFATKCNEDGWLNKKSYLELHVQGIHRPTRQLREGRRLAGRGRPRKGRRNADMSTFSKRAAWAQARRTGRMASRGQQDTVMKTRNPEDNAQIDVVIQSLVESSQLVWNTIKERFNLMIISHEQLEARLHNAADYFRVRPTEDINAFVLHVRHRF